MAAQCYFKYSKKENKGHVYEDELFQSLLNLFNNGMKCLIGLLIFDWAIWIDMFT